MHVLGPLHATQAPLTQYGALVSLQSESNEQALLLDTRELAHANSAAAARSKARTALAYYAAARRLQPSSCALFQEVHPMQRTARTAGMKKEVDDTVEARPLCGG